MYRIQTEVCYFSDIHVLILEYFKHQISSNLIKGLSIYFLYTFAGVCTYPIPLPHTCCNTRSIFKQSLIGMNSDFFFSLTSCYTKVKETSLPYFVLIAERRIVEFISFLRVLVLYVIQTALSRIWTLIAVFISYDDNS